MQETSANQVDLPKTLVRGARLLLDTNVWRYIIDCDAERKISEAAWRAGVGIAVAPVIVQEVRALDDALLRKRILAAVCASNRVRLLTDALLECDEAFTEISRHAPDLVIPIPKMQEYRRLRYDWTRKSGGFWERARCDAQEPLAEESLRSARSLEFAREESRVVRKSVAQRDPRGASAPLQSVAYEFTEPIEGFGTGTVAYWRVPSLHHFKSELAIYASPVREWLDCRLDVFELLGRPDRMNSLWLEGLTATGMRRQWLLGAHDFLQSWRKTTPGTPRDAQLSVHLVDVDVLATSDKNLAHVVRRCNAEAPFPCAAALQLPGGTGAVEGLIRALSD